LITHRREVAMAADHVVVLEGARVVDAGPPRELAARSDAFARLFEIDRDSPRPEVDVVGTPGAGVEA
jgi:ABC-type multidrug transport system fused ATPase/permease subunit